MKDDSAREAANTAGADPVLVVENLTIDFPSRPGAARAGGRDFEGRESAGALRAVDGLSFTLAPGRCLGLVGESGSGKSATALALLGLHRGTSARIGGRITVEGVDLHSADDEQVRRLRGSKIAMVFQDPLSSLDPYMGVGDQIAEVYRTHTGAGRRAARARAIEVLDRVGIADAARRAEARPHQFSGGMRQRVLIAMALACEPRILVADEPTTALDVTVQAQILDLLYELREQNGLALVLVTHDFGVVAAGADEVLVMRHGRAVEYGSTEQVLGGATAEYTRELIAAVPRIDLEGLDHLGDPGSSSSVRSFSDSLSASASSASASTSASASPSADPDVLIRLRDLRKQYPGGHASGLATLRGVPGFRRAAPINAVDGVSLDIRRGEALGIVGESGSGKTTLARMLVSLLKPTSGTIELNGRDLTRLSDRRLRPLRRDAQMVFQDPAASLNPRRTVGDSIADPLRAQGIRDERRIRTEVHEALDRVGLQADHYDRFPHEFSGGQRQRVGIARALILRPNLVVCDEPVSALDVTTQAQVVRLLAELRKELGLTLVFVAHDLAVVRQVSDRVAVMNHGRIVELADAQTLYRAPGHPYTRQLLAAVPIPDPAAARRQREFRRAAAAALGSGQA
jgi:peptide/nickel transport system ATP-binding protein